MEQLRDEVSRILLTLEKSELICVCEHLKCSEPSGGFASQAQRALIRLAETTLDDMEDEEDSESLQQYLQRLLSLVDSLKQPHPNASETVQNEASELDTLRDKYKKLQQEQNEARQLLEEEIGVLEERLKIKPQAEDTRTATSLPTTLPEVTLRGEFRICGQIGEAGQRETVLYKPH